jgi:hypothetical protein
MCPGAGGSCPADERRAPVRPRPQDNDPATRRDHRRLRVPALADRPRVAPRPPDDGPPSRRAASPHFPASRPPGTQPEPGCAPLGVPVIHAVSLQLQLVTRKVRPHNGARRPNVVDRDPRRSSRFGIGAIAGRAEQDQDRQSSLPRPDCHALRALRSAESRGRHDDNGAPEARGVDGHTAQRQLPGPDDDDAAASLDLDPCKRVNLAADLHAPLALKREHQTSRPGKSDPARSRHLTDLYMHVVLALAADDHPLRRGNRDDSLHSFREWRTAGSSNGARRLHDPRSTTLSPRCSS